MCVGVGLGVGIGRGVLLAVAVAVVVVVGGGLEGCTGLSVLVVPCVGLVSVLGLCRGDLLVLSFVVLSV